MSARTRTARRAAALVVALVTGVACSSSDTSANGADGGGVPTFTFDANSACATSADCAKGLVCAFAVAGGCGAPGTCIYDDCVEDPECPPLPAHAACGCDGQPVAYVTAAYASAPVASPDACAAGPHDASLDTGADAPAGDAAHE
jgi:hypothetical protein